MTLEDQQQINKFARHNAKLQDLKEELKTKQVKQLIIDEIGQEKCCL